GYVEQRHASLLGRAAAFGGIAAPARRDSIGPHIPPASRDRHHMVTGKIAQHETRAAIGAQLPIACEQQRVCQARRVSVSRCAAALDRQDQLGRDARTLAVSLEAAAILANKLAYRPCDQM